MKAVKSQMEKKIEKEKSAKPTHCSFNCKHACLQKHFDGLELSIRAFSSHGTIS